MAAAQKILPLELRGVSFSAGGRTLIEDVSFTVEGGPLTVVLGPNGAGKSLLLRLCNGLLQPTSGSIRWHGSQAACARLHQGMVFQRPLMLRRSVAANVNYALKLRAVPKAEREKRIGEALALLGLENEAGRSARLLSFGQQQKLALARAWAQRPEVLFLDEPTASLDPAAIHTFELAVKAIRQAGTTIVMSTHDLAQARRLADEVLFVHAGRLIERGPTDRFFQHPQSHAAAAFLKGELLWNTSERTVSSCV
jgi:tungstate transport system ATP-binding protein